MRSRGRSLLVTATVLAAGLALTAARLPPPWSWLALAVVLAYLLLLVAGVMLPGLALFAPVICAGPPSRPEVALTFDDGPDARSTPLVLDRLAAAGVPATFFVLGEKARIAPDLLHRMTAAGHEVAIHGDTHDRFLSVRPPAVIAAGLERALATVAAATGIRPSRFRPPIGHVSPRTAVAARALRLDLVGWSVRARDGRARTTAREATRRVVAGLRPGAIILMHDAAERGDRQPVAIAALPAILDEIARRGLHCVTLSELLRP